MWGHVVFRLNADKIDINGNREINLLIQNMRDKVDKTDIVNSLNLSREVLISMLIELELKAVTITDMFEYRMILLN